MISAMTDLQNNIGSAVMLPQVTSPSPSAHHQSNTTNAIPLMRHMRTVKEIKQFVKNVDSMIVGAQEDPNLNVRPYLLQSPSEVLQLLKGFSFELQRPHPIKYGDVTTGKEWETWGWMKMKVFLEDIIDHIKPYNKLDVDRTYWQVHNRICRLQPINQYLDFSCLESKTLEPFRQRIIALDTEIRESWEELFSDKQQTSLLHELVKRICRNPEARECRHLLRHVSTLVNDKIKEQKVTTPLEFLSAVVHELKELESLFLGFREIAGIVIKWDPMPSELIPTEEEEEEYKEEEYKEEEYEDEGTYDRSTNNNNNNNKRKRKRVRNIHLMSAAELKACLPHYEWPSRHGKRAKKKKSPQGTVQRNRPTHHHCWGCGRLHERKCCALANHPNYNIDPVPWKDSWIGRQWAARHEHKLPANRTLAGEYIEIRNYENMLALRKDAQRTKAEDRIARKKKGKKVSAQYDENYSSDPYDDPPNYYHEEPPPYHHYEPPDHHKEPPYYHEEPPYQYEPPKHYERPNHYEPPTNEVISEDDFFAAFEMTTTTHISVDQEESNKLLSDEPTAAAMKVMMLASPETIIIPTHSMDMFRSLISLLQFQFGVRIILDEKTRKIDILSTDRGAIKCAQHHIRDMIHHSPDSFQAQVEALKVTRLHVFVDESNILLGARQCIHRKVTHSDPNNNNNIKNYHNNNNIHTTIDPLALASVVIHGRYCYQQVVYGSIPSSSSSTKSSSNDTSPARPIWESIDFQVHTYERHAGGGEQFVDDALIASMNHAILTYLSPPHPQHTLVLLTGDGNENHGRVNFKDTVQKALLHGWRVELWSWKACLSRAYLELALAYEGTDLFRIIYLDDYHEILFQ